MSPDRIPHQEVTEAEAHWPPAQATPLPIPFGQTEASDLALAAKPEQLPESTSSAAPAPVRAVAWDPKADAAEARSAAVLRPTEEDYSRLRWAQRRGAIGSGMVVATGLFLLLPTTSPLFNFLLFALTALGSIVAYETGDTAPRWAICLGIAGLAVAFIQATSGGFILAGLLMAGGWTMGMIREST